MKVYFRAECDARVTEYWSIHAPATWGDMDGDERVDFLEENFDSADFQSEQVHDEQERKVLDYRVS
jgi:hypothetical protein